jgi:hypothetical protein
MQKLIPGCYSMPGEDACIDADLILVNDKRRFVRMVDYYALKLSN